MAILKCKMCGGDIELSADKTIGVCDSCGSTMTFPKVDDEQRANAFNRGNHFRRSGEFDKALAVYERIVQEDETDAEAHWCCALCRFGIEYVEDPNTFEYLPTCHRASFDSFLEDVDYLAALEHSDGVTRRQYQRDAAKIAEVQRGILATSQNEEPFDVFICYKESENDGSRTRDSLLAQDIYYQLTEQGRRVFFSRITLEDKAGTEYEPYIFAALNSAKVMILVTTSAEHANAVWVKNEWSRFLSLMRKDRSKLLLPCYRDMDPYDLPEALSVLQSYDMSKIGFIQDLIRGVNKVLDAEKSKESVKETVVVQQQGSASVAPLLERAFMFLEDGNWEKADEFCERVLNLEPKNAEAYLGKLMAELHVQKREELKNQPKPFNEHSNYQKAIRFGEKALQTELTNSIEQIHENVRRNTYKSAESLVSEDSIEALHQAADIFDSLGDYRDAPARSVWCLQRIEELNNEQAYLHAEAIIRDDFEMLKEAAELFSSLGDYRDAPERQKWCINRIDELHKKQAEELCIKAKMLMERMEFTKAIQIFQKLGEYKDSSALLAKCQQLFSARREQLTPMGKWIAAGGYHTVGLKRNGTVIATGKNEDGQCEVSGWRNIIAISAGTNHTIGLKEDGTAVATGYNYFGQCNVSEWTNLIMVAAGGSCSVGLKRDGTVVATGENYHGQCDVSKWSNIVSISAGSGYVLGLTRDGRVLAAGSNSSGQCNISDWSDIVSIVASSGHTVGLKSDGSVFAVGNNHFRQCDVSDWTDIVAIAAGSSHTVGLKSNGTIVIAGINNVVSSNLADWSDIVAITAGNSHTVGLKSDGTVVAFGSNKDGQCDVDKWWLSSSSGAINKEHISNFEQQLLSIQNSKQSAEIELANLKGMFTGKRRKELEAQIAEAEKQIAALREELDKLR